jgi:hypothetical protein
MTTGSDIELQRLREQLRQAEERVREEQANRLRAEERAGDEQMNRLRAERQVQEEQTRNENTTFRDFLEIVSFRFVQTNSDSG